MSLSQSADQPIFVDDTMRRRRLVLAAGGIAAGAVALASLAMVSGLTTAGARQAPAWPDAGAPGQQSVSATQSADQEQTGYLGLPAATGASTIATPVPSGENARPTSSPSASATRRRGGTRW